MNKNINKNKIKKMTAVFLLVLFSFVTGCSNESGNSSSGSGQSSSTQADPQTDNLSDLDQFLNIMEKSPEELKTEISEATASAELTGKIWGKEAKGIGTFGIIRQDGTRILSEISLEIEDCTVWEAYQLLIEKCGGPVSYDPDFLSQTEEKTASWYLFDFGEHQIRIGKNEGDKKISLKITQNPDPDYQGQLVLGEDDSNQEVSGSDSNIVYLPFLLDMGVDQYEDGILVLKLINRTGKEAEYSGEMALYRLEGGQYVTLHTVVRLDEVPENAKIQDGQDVYLTVDLRNFGKVLPGKYMIDMDHMKAFFTLVEEISDNK